MTGSALALPLLLAAAAVGEVRIPAIGQPSPFYGAAGKGVTVTANAEPTELTADDFVTYTLRVSKLDNAADVQRPDLNEIEPFRTDFQIEDEKTAEVEPAGTRIFRYRLRPRRADVVAIPVFTLPYYDPSQPQPADNPGFPFRRARTQPIPLRVRKPAGPPPLPPVPLDVPDFAATPAVSTPTAVPGWAWWLAAAVPPVVAVGGCAVWRALNPAGARLARRRRSRAARSALRTLHGLARHTPADPAAVVWCVSAYLAERFDLPGVFRTPNELAARLREAGASPAIATECEAFVRAADAARFAPGPDTSCEALIADAERLVRQLEDEA
ncbi:MAG TPA: hypothetical protein VKD90_23520 [Gemmataceae bacterium]|nr:hypothetical protein [Gemmataceae bacterium]